MAIRAQYTLYVDESGDSGIVRIRSDTAAGATPYMVLGGALVPNSHKAKVGNCLSQLATLFGKNELHCNRLKHNQIVRYATDIAGQKFLAFGVISFKHTLGKYSADIGDDNTAYYHKCMLYLLESVGQALEEMKISSDQVDVCIESGIVSLGRLKKLVKTCQLNPMHRRTKFLCLVDAQRIYEKEKLEEPLLQLPDLVSYALYRCLDRTDNNYNVLEPRYLVELKNKFYSKPKDGKIVDWGIRAIHSLGQLELPIEVRRVLRELRAEKRK